MPALRRPLLALAAVALAAFVAVPAAPAVAAQQDGYVRLAHMSPDTAAVNITLSSLSGDVTLFRLKNVGYGAVSKYMRLPQGTYALAMVPAGSKAGAKPVVSGSIDVSAGKAETVAAVGLNKDLTTKAFSDDLSDGGSGNARVRVVQASVDHKDVVVKDGSTSIADGTAFGAVTDYASVKSGSARFTLTSGSDSKTVPWKLAAGSTNTLFVIDDSHGDLAVAQALDSAAATETPVGSLAAGGGGLDVDAAGPAGLLAVLSGVGGIAVAGVLARRRVLAARA